VPSKVSPGLGNSGADATKSKTRLPTTTTRALLLMATLYQLQTINSTSRGVRILPGSRFYPIVWVLDVVIERELIRMRTQPDGVDFLLALVPDPGADDVAGEDVALQQELMVLFEGIQRFVERTRGLRHLGQFLGFEIVDVLVERIARLDLVLDAV